MAIDGAGIIDSDLAHDIYNEFIDYYDAGLSVPEIRNKILSWEDELSDDLEREIFYSVYFFSLWEAGELTENEFKDLEKIVIEEKGLAIWNKIDPQLCSERRENLFKLLRKISKPKKSPRARKKYKKIKDFIFEIGECLVYKVGDRIFPVFIYEIDQHRGECLYSMAVLNYSLSKTPNLKEFQRGEFIGRIITGSSVYGLTVVRPEHRELLKYKEKFERIGSINIRMDNTCVGSFGGILTQQDFEEELLRIVDDRQLFDDELIKMKEVLNMSIFG